MIPSREGFDSFPAHSARRPTDVCQASDRVRALTGHWRCRYQVKSVTRFRRAEAPALVGALAAAVAGFVLLVPAARFQVISPAAVPIILAARGMAEVFVGYLASQRFVRNASPVDFGIAVALGITVVADVVYMLNRSTLAPDGNSAAAVLPYHLVSAAVLAAAALAPRRPLFAHGRGSAILVAVAMLALVPLLLMGAGAIPDYGVTSTLEPHDAAVLRLVVCGLLVVTVLGLALSRDTRNQPLTRWLAVAAFLAALAEIQRVAEPLSTVAAFTWLQVWHLGVALALFVGATRRGALRPAPAGAVGRRGRAAAPGARPARRRRPGHGVHRQPEQVPGQPIRRSAAAPDRGRCRPRAGRLPCRGGRAHAHAVRVAQRGAGAPGRAVPGSLGPPRPARARVRGRSRPREGGRDPPHRRRGSVERGAPLRRERGRDPPRLPAREAAWSPSATTGAASTQGWSAWPTTASGCATCPSAPASSAARCASCPSPGAGTRVEILVP